MTDLEAGIEALGRGGPSELIFLPLQVKAFGASGTIPHTRHWRQPGLTLIWPLYIAVIPAGVLVAVLNRGTPLYLAALAVIVIGTLLAQWQRVEPRPAVAELSSPPIEGVGVPLIVLTVLTLAAITVVPEFLTTQLALPILIDDGSMTAIVAVALAMPDLPRWARA